MAVGKTLDSLVNKRGYDQEGIGTIKHHFEVFF